MLKKKFAPAFAGIRKGFSHRSVKIQYILGILAVIAGVIMKLTAVEWAAVIICIGAVITSEMLNTCIEKLCDLYSVEHNEKIGFIKDVAAGAVLTMSIASLAVALMILAHHLV